MTEQKTIVLIDANCINTCLPDTVRMYINPECQHMPVVNAKTGEKVVISLSPRFNIKIPNEAVLYPEIDKFIQKYNDKYKPDEIICCFSGRVFEKKHV